MRVLGEYRVGRTIGKGAFSKVKIAHHKETGEKIAIKVISKKELQASYEKKQKQRAEKEKRKALRDHSAALKRESEGREEEILIRQASMNGNGNGDTEEHPEKGESGNSAQYSNSNQGSNGGTGTKSHGGKMSAREFERARRADAEAKQKAKEAARQADKDDEMSQHTPGTFSKYLSREARLLQVLDHPNVTRLYQLIETEDTYLIVMQYAGGGELVEYMANGGLLEVEARRLFREIISAIDHCHQCGVLHRDLKLENILLSEDVHVRITDFGLGRRYDADDIENSLSNTFCGTPLYAAPELVSGTRYDGPPADIWAMGVVLYAMMCGSPPFHGDRMSQLYRRIKDVEYTMPEEMSDNFRELISKIFVRDPKKRMTMNELREDDWVTDGSKLGPPPRVPPRFIPDKPIIDCPKSKAEEDDRTESIAFVDNALVYRFFPTESELKQSADILNEGSNAQAAGSRKPINRRMSLKGMSFRNRSQSANNKDHGLLGAARSSVEDRRSSHTAGVSVTLNHSAHRDGTALPHATNTGAGWVIDISDDVEEAVVPRERSAHSQDKGKRRSAGSAKDFRVNGKKREPDPEIPPAQPAHGSSSLARSVTQVHGRRTTLSAAAADIPATQSSTGGKAFNRRRSFSQALSQGLRVTRAKPSSRSAQSEDLLAIRRDVVTPTAPETPGERAGDESAGTADGERGGSDSLRLHDEVDKIGGRRNTLSARHTSLGGSKSLASIRRTLSRVHMSTPKGPKKGVLSSDTHDLGGENAGGNENSAFATLRVHRNVVPVPVVPGEEVPAVPGRAARAFSVGGGVDFEAYSSLHIRNNSRLNPSTNGDGHSAATINRSHSPSGTGPLGLMGSASASDILARGVSAQAGGTTQTNGVGSTMVGGVSGIDKDMASKLNNISVNAAAAAAEIAALSPKARRESMSLVLKNMRRAESDLLQVQEGTETNGGAQAQAQAQPHTQAPTHTRTVRGGSWATKPSTSTEGVATVHEHGDATNTTERVAAKQHHSLGDVFEKHPTNRVERRRSIASSRAPNKASLQALAAGSSDRRRSSTSTKATDRDAAVGAWVKAQSRVVPQMPAVIRQRSTSSSRGSRNRGDTGPQATGGTGAQGIGNGTTQMGNKGSAVRRNRSMSNSMDNRVSGKSAGKGHKTKTPEGVSHTQRAIRHSAEVLRQRSTSNGTKARQDTVAMATSTPIEAEAREDDNSPSQAITGTENRAGQSVVIVGGVVDDVDEQTQGTLRKQSKSSMMEAFAEGERRVRVRSVRGMFRLTCVTGKMKPMEFVAEIERVLTMHGLYYEYVGQGEYLAIRVKYNSQSESVVFEIEVVQVWLLSLVGMRASRRTGSVWLFKQIYSQIKGSLAINT
ncbi:CAMK/CAMKL/MARK protein kinase [Sphaeroforma arctica JP610]|uniref:non-specific serine/threonine protein kinase n=1 Tax=Sphaeroforma arctica JP610 TaxID=667725 RepID=A0A0L0FI96_9EUKA|nr:CAMK/CAMKL/MARK protein kinase [Sphaeroforma arctica JP610]KNC76181.1 CAMK/CAMKL/MARK protein kinase [Sphaeroforma arctica JP610]|eukprot:XP_014150083.1 CAMK/CAMKL/MARK protein kinase [Sphaeroforma arctica JP610]